MGAMNLRPSALLKTLAILGVFICVVSYSYWGRLVSIPANYIHRKPLPSQDFQFDNPTGQNWTNRIWQTSKLPVVAIGDEDREHVKTWSDLNPEYRHEILTDEMMESYVKDHFHSSHPDIEQIYLEVKDYILRSDFIRYLILLADGGVYNDLDVGCEKPINTWVPPQYKDSAGVLLGVEVDNKFGPDGRKFKGGQDLFQLVNWTIMSKPNQPFMWFLVKRVMDNIRNLAASRNQPISRTTYSIQDVLDVTGPAALTKAFFDYASDITDSNVTYHNFTKINKARLIGEVVVLPIHAFGAGHQVEWAGWKQTDGTPLVHHYFAGSWKTDHYDKAPQPLSVGEEQRKEQQDTGKAEEAKKKQAEVEKAKQIEGEAEKKKQHAQEAQEAADKIAEEIKKVGGEKAADEQQQSATKVGDSSASSMTSTQPFPDSSYATKNKQANDQEAAAADGLDDEAASDKAPSVNHVEDQTAELDSTIVAVAEQESMHDMLAKMKAEKEVKAKAEAEKLTNEAAKMAKEKEMEENLAAEDAAEKKAEMEAWLEAQEDSKSDEKKDEDVRKAGEQKEEDEKKAKEQEEEEERKAKWEEIKKVAPKTAPKKTDEEKQKSSNDLGDYDYIPD